MANEQPTEPTNSKMGGRARQIRIGASVLLVLVIGVSLYWWFFIRNYVSTDDAYAKADSAMISSRIPGTVIKVSVHNDYSVRTGQPLLELDPTDYKVAVDKAKAALDQVTAELKAAEIMVPPVGVQTSSNVAAAQAALSGAMDTVTQTSHSIDQLKESRAAAAAQLALAARDRQRFAALSQKGAGTQRRQEQAQTEYEMAKARVSGIDAQIAAAKASL
ncbi:MAG: HlyD family secretion protein, partial [Syntrophobacteraceae bacterium]